MRVFHVSAERFTELSGWPDALPASGFLWLGLQRSELQAQATELQTALLRWAAGPLVDLHLADLLNDQLPSHFDYTSWYDLLVFRRLAAAAGSSANGLEGEPARPVAASPDAAAHTVQQALNSIDTSPIGFAVFDRFLVTVHPQDCVVLQHFAARLASMAGGAPAGPAAAEVRGSARLPSSPPDLMLRMVNHIVDNYLDLRRLLTRQLGSLQRQLLSPKSRFDDWSLLLDQRNALHQLEDICEDQRSAMQEWIDGLDEWPDETEPDKRRERELLRVRSRDVLEHVERVLSHVRRMEQSAESAVQMHFSALGHRTNDIMRTLTVLTAIFLPLNLITGYFGMNFEALPLIHSPSGFWIASAGMLLVGLGLVTFFWRKRYLGTQRRA